MTELIERNPVLLRGLAGDFNGRFGILVSHQSDDRWEIDVDGITVLVSTTSILPKRWHDVVMFSKFMAGSVDITSALVSAQDDKFGFLQESKTWTTEKFVCVDLSRLGTRRPWVKNWCNLICNSQSDRLFPSFLQGISFSPK